jgi:hypothetical protein
MAPRRLFFRSTSSAERRKHLPHRQSSTKLVALLLSFDIETIQN